MKITELVAGLKKNKQSFHFRDELKRAIETFFVTLEKKIGVVDIIVDIPLQKNRLTLQLTHCYPTMYLEEIIESEWAPIYDLRDLPETISSTLLIEIAESLNKVLIAIRLRLMEQIAEHEKEAGSLRGAHAAAIGIENFL